jgi:sugar lactone lactonase YvrE
MSNSSPIRVLSSHVGVVLIAAVLCAVPAEAQFVNTVIATNLSTPSGVAVDSSNNVYITDSANNRIALFVPTSGSLSTLAGLSGADTWGTNNGPGPIARFDNPQGIVAARGGLVVADENNSLIRYVTYSGVVSTIAGVALQYGHLDANGTSALFSFPIGVAVDSLSNIFVADSQNNDIREIDINNNVTTVAINNGYHFNNPTAVAVDGSGNLWVADTGNDVICLVSNSTATVIAGIFRTTGTNDALIATEAEFKQPAGLLWDSSSDSLLISDTGNHTIRQLFLTNALGYQTYAVQTLAGTPGVSGLVNGVLSAAEFDGPIGITVDPFDGGFYIADSLNNALRVLEPTAPLPAVTAPELGYVIFPATATPPYTSVFVEASSAVFNNLTNIVIDAEQGTETYISYGPTGSAIPPPGPGTDTPPTYPGDGSTAAEISSIISPGPGTNDITIYAIGVQSGRLSSPVVSARYQFVTANPIISGDNAADVLLTDITSGADLYYTINGTTPTNDGSSLGPVSSETTLSFGISSNVLLQVRAFASGLATSQTTSTELSVSNLMGNQVTWGFSSGPVSTHFTTALNLLFTAPVTFTELFSSLDIYAMQLDLTVTNNGPTPPPAFGFVSDLLQPIQNEPNFYLPIPPGIYINGVTNSGIITQQTDTMEVAWLVTPAVSNLYSSTKLLEFSGAVQLLFELDSDGVAVLGALSFVVPASAAPGTPYTLQISYPSASSYTEPQIAGPPINVFVQAPINGPTTGTGPNAIKLVTVLPNNSPASAHLVGDVFPYTWFNIGDFGDGVLQNDDVIETMEYVGTVDFDNNPYFDAMDSSDGSVNDYYTASDSEISAISTGDGKINVDDVYVTLRRSLDPSLTNYSRYWTGTAWVPTVYTNSVQQSSSPSPKLTSNGPRYITVAADQVNTAGSRTAQVPIRLLAADTLPVTVFMVNVVLEPLDGSPPITTAVSFSAVTNLGSPYATVSQSVNNYAAAWLNSAVPGVSGTNVIGTLTVTLPPNVTTNSAYLVHFNHFSASPNGIALFNATVQDGLITVGNRSGSSWGDGIPDSWRLLYFGTVSNGLSAAEADPDGDGANNWQEFIAGTNPLDAASVFEFMPATTPSGSDFTLQWPSVVNKSYSVQSSSSLSGGWVTVATNLIGNGQPMQWTDTGASGAGKFYRALVH